MADGAIADSAPGLLATAGRCGQTVAALIRAAFLLVQGEITKAVSLAWYGLCSFDPSSFQLTKGMGQGVMNSTVAAQAGHNSKRRSLP